MFVLIFPNICTIYYDAAPCNTGELQLFGGNVPNEGRVEVCISTNLWSTVCDDNWGSIDATVVCRQLGYSTQGMKLVWSNDLDRAFLQ